MVLWIEHKATFLDGGALKAYSNLSKTFPGWALFSKIGLFLSLLCSQMPSLIMVWKAFFIFRAMQTDWEKKEKKHSKTLIRSSFQTGVGTIFWRGAEFNVCPCALSNADAGFFLISLVKKGWDVANRGALKT